MYLDYYLNELGYNNIPDFLYKYLKDPSLLRLKGVGYFCGMDYASKDIYNFKEHITRFDHSLTVSLMTYKLTKDKTMTLAGLFHDISTPCFSHVIDYMNNDHEKQESTEKYTKTILKNNNYLIKCLKEDSINIDDITNFKKYSIVDNNRPKLCADRLDGTILTGISWTNNITKKDICNILKDIYICKNENNEDEIAFRSYDIAKKVVEINDKIDEYCHMKEDIYMMELLAKITKLAIYNNYILYEDLYYSKEKELLEVFKNRNDANLNKYIDEFENIKKTNIKDIDIPKIKVRKLKPLVKGKRF